MVLCPDIESLPHTDSPRKLDTQWSKCGNIHILRQSKLRIISCEGCSPTGALTVSRACARKLGVLDLHGFGDAAKSPSSRTHPIITAFTMATNPVRALFRLPLRRMFSTSSPASNAFLGRSYDGASDLDSQRSRMPQSSPFDIAGVVDPAVANEDTEGFTPQEMLSNAHRFRQGEMYSPHDLTIEEMKKRRMERRKNFRDVFDVLGVNPIDEYKVYLNRQRHC